LGNLLFYVVVLFVYQTRNRDHSSSSAAFELHNSLSAGSEKLCHKGGRSASATNGNSAASEKTINSKQDTSGSKMKKAANKTCKVRKMCKVTSADDNHSQKSKKISTAAAQDKEKNIVMKTANENIKMRKHGKVVKSAIVPSDVITTKPTKNRSVSSCKQKCTDSLSTGNVVRKAGDVQCKSTKTERDGTSLSASFRMTTKPTRKMTNSVAAGSVKTCSEVDISVSDAAKETVKEHQDTLSCAANLNVTFSLHQRTSQLPADDVVYEGGDTAKCTKLNIDAVQTVQETVIKDKILAPCSSFGMTLRSGRRSGLAGGSTVCEEARSVVHCSEEKNGQVAKIAEETNNKYKCIPPCSDSQRLRRTDQLATGDGVCKQPNASIHSNNSCVEIREEEVKEHRGQSLCSNSDATTHGTNHSVTSKLLSEEGNSAVDFSEVSINVVESVKETSKKYKDPSACSGFSITLRSRTNRHCFPSDAGTGVWAGNAGDSAVKRDIAGTMNEVQKGCEDAEPCVNFGVALQPRGAKKIHTEYASVCQNVSRVMGTSCTKVDLSQYTDGVRKGCNGLSPCFHMTLRPHQRQQDDVMAGKTSQIASISVSMKHHSLKFKDEEYNSEKPCWNGGQNLCRCSKS